MKKLEGFQKESRRGTGPGRHAPTLTPSRISATRFRGANRPASNIDRTFSALADPIRRSILERLTRGDAYPTELAEPFDVSLPAISKHLRVLEGAGLIVREREGQYLRCRFVSSPITDAATWMEGCRRRWEEHLDELTTYLANSKKAGET
jgi:DNA-binding transcriptional ArsR family regulator